MRAYIGTEYHDIMSYCPLVWLSPYTYINILQRINDEAASIVPLPSAAGPLSAESFAEARMPQPTQWLNVVGTVDLTDRAGTIDFVQPLTAVDFPAGQSTDVAIRLLDAQGATVAELPARVKLDTCINADEHLGGVVDTFVPHDDGISTIQLQIDGEVVATYTAATGILDDGAGPLEASESTSVRYSVQVSPDQGATWQTVAVGLTDPETYNVGRSDFPSTPTLRRRVLETEGFHSRIVSDEQI